MPELPEVETVRTQLDASITGRIIRSALLRRKDLRIPFPDGFCEAVSGRKIVAVKRRAKYLLLLLDDGQVIIAHLGMTGRFSVVGAIPNQYEAHDHAAFFLDDGRVVIFNDARRFGLMELSQHNTLPGHRFFSHLGPEPLEKAFSRHYLKKQLEKRSAPVKPVLMDQRVVVGVGNIYASEALYLCKINPLSPAKLVSEQSSVLVKSIQKVLRAAIESGGSSLRDFVQVSGDSGYFQHAFQVYGRKGKPCFRCETPIAQITQAGRSSFYCPKCQPELPN
jgi:formamidopyrimidine-DNA glycosylase